MPIYEYLCEKCGHAFDVMQKITDKPLNKCPKCEGKLKKLISQSSFILKGSGWYVTDYTRKGKGEEKEKKEKKEKDETSKKTPQKHNSSSSAS